MSENSSKSPGYDASYVYGLIIQRGIAEAAAEVEPVPPPESMTELETTTELEIGW